MAAVFQKIYVDCGFYVYSAFFQYIGDVFPLRLVSLSQ